MTNPTDYLHETGSILGLPSLSPRTGETVGITFSPGQVASLDISNWPLVTLYRSIEPRAPDDLAAHYRHLLALNAELESATLACDEKSTLHLIQSVHTELHTPEEFAACLRQFAELGAAMPQRIEPCGGTPAFNAPPSIREHLPFSDFPTPEFRIFA